MPQLGGVDPKALLRILTNTDAPTDANPGPQTMDQLNARDKYAYGLMQNMQLQGNAYYTPMNAFADSIRGYMGGRYLDKTGQATKASFGNDAAIATEGITGQRPQGMPNISEAKPSVPGAAPSGQKTASLDPSAPIPPEGMVNDGKPFFSKGGVPLVRITGPNDTKVTVAKEHADKFVGLFTDLAAAGYNIKPQDTSGYNYRNIRGTNKPSEHARGFAVDVNATSNGRGTKGDIPPELARQLAAKHGLTWGGDWKNPDPMHFEINPSAAAKPQDGMTTGSLPTQSNIPNDGIVPGSPEAMGAPAGGGLPTQPQTMLNNQNQSMPLKPPMSTPGMGDGTLSMSPQQVATQVGNAGGAPQLPPGGGAPKPPMPLGGPTGGAPAGLDPSGGGQSGAPDGGTGGPQMPGQQMAQNQPSGQLRDLPTNPASQMSPEQLFKILRSPTMDPQIKKMFMDKAIAQGEMQTLAVEGGKLLYNAKTGKQMYEPEPKFDHISIKGITTPVMMIKKKMDGPWQTFLMDGTQVPEGGGGSSEGGQSSSAGTAPASPGGIESLHARGMAMEKREEQQKGQIERQNTARKEQISGGDTADATLDLTQRMRQFENAPENADLTTGALSGPWNEFKKTWNTLPFAPGKFDEGKITLTDLYNGIATNVAAQLARKSDPNPSLRQFEAFIKSTPGMAQTPAARKALILSLEHMANRDKEISMVAKKMGVDEDSKDPEIEAVKQKYRKMEVVPKQLLETLKGKADAKMQKAKWLSDVSEIEGVPIGGTFFTPDGRYRERTQ